MGPSLLTQLMGARRTGCHVPDSVREIADLSPARIGKYVEENGSVFGPTRAADAVVEFSLTDSLSSRQRLVMAIGLPRVGASLALRTDSSSFVNVLPPAQYRDALARPMAELARVSSKAMRSGYTS